MSILIPMIQGYLLHRNYKYPRDALVRDANSIAKKIRDTFGRFDESDQSRCAMVIRAVMEKPIAPTVRLRGDPQAEQQAHEKKIVADYLARKERDQRLKRAFCF